MNVLARNREDRLRQAGTGSHRVHCRRRHATSCEKQRSSRVGTIFCSATRFIFFQKKKALNNLQATHSGFGTISTDNVFKVWMFGIFIYACVNVRALSRQRQVCDQPHPVFVQQLLEHCIQRRVDDATKIMIRLHSVWTAPVFCVCVCWLVSQRRRRHRLSLVAGRLCASGHHLHVVSRRESV